MLAKVAFALLSAASSVLAHGNLQEIVVENPPATYVPWLPFTDSYMPTPPGRVGRKFPDNGPVEDVTSVDIQCNKGAVPAALIATAAAGSQVALNWTKWPDSHIGPVITYLAKAPSDITKWSPGTDKVWFKIEEAGLDNGKWAATDILLTQQKSIWTVTIPRDLKPGQYLMRHEIIALHSAGSYPGAQFYPSCIQFDITGSGTSLPNDSDLVSFPGAYSGTDPGVKFNPYAGATTYTIPGPPVWDGAGSGSGSGSGSVSGGSGPIPSAGAPSSAVASSKAVASSSADAAEPAYEPVKTEVSTSAPAASSTTNDSYKVPASTAAPSTTEGSYLAPASSQDPANSYPVSDSADATEPVDGPIKTEVSTSAPAATSITDDSYKAPVSTAPSTIIDGAYKAPASPQAPTYSSGAAPATHTGGAADLAPLYAQCGGANFIPKNCVAPYICKDWNPYYSQCIGV